jgi:hypothetical protein
MSIISNLIRKAVKKDGPLNILTFFYDGRFDIELLKTGHHFYGCLQHSAFPWPGFERAEYKNLHILNDIAEANNIGLDLVLFNSRMAHQQFFQFAKSLHLPSLIIDHDFNQHNSFILEQIKAQTSLPSISCLDEIKNQFNSQETIYYGIEKKIGEYEKDIDILMCGNFAEGDIFAVHNLKMRFPTLKLVGQNPTIPYSELVSTYEDYKNLFKRTKVFLNLLAQPNISYEILWALQYKAAIVSSDLPQYKGLLENKVNALLVNKAEQVHTVIQNIVHDKKLYEKLTTHQTDLSKFDDESFVNKWNNRLETFRYQTYIT